MAALGGLLFGFDTAVIAGATHALTDAYQLSPAALGLTVASALWGTILGAMFAGIPGDRYGRRDSLRVMAILYVISALGCAFAWDWYSLVFFRLIGGLGIGGSSVLGPMYIAEIAPAKWRGRLVGFFQFNVVGGHPAGLFFELPDRAWPSFGAAEWRWKLGVSASPADPFLPFAVRHSAQPALAGEERPHRGSARCAAPDRRGERRGRAAGHRRFHRCRPWPRRRTAFPAQVPAPDFSGRFHRHVQPALGDQRHPLLLERYFRESWIQQGLGRFASRGHRRHQFAVYHASPCRSSINSAARRCCWWVPSARRCAWPEWHSFSRRLSIEDWLVWLLVGYIAFFAFSQGAVIWVYLSEVFPNRVRAKGQSLGSTTHWVMNAIISGVFPVLAARSGAVPFLFFSAMMVVQLFVVLSVYPETKGVSLEELQKKLGIA